MSATIKNNAVSIIKTINKSSFYAKYYDFFMPNAFAVKGCNLIAFFWLLIILIVGMLKNEFSFWDIGIKSVILLLTYQSISFVIGVFEQYFDSYGDIEIKDLNRDIFFSNLNTTQRIMWCNFSIKNGSLNNPITNNNLLEFKRSLKRGEY